VPRIGSDELDAYLEQVPAGADWLDTDDLPDVEGGKDCDHSFGHAIPRSLYRLLRRGMNLSDAVVTT
jgi:hypothetical protein